MITSTRIFLLSVIGIAAAMSSMVISNNDLPPPSNYKKCCPKNSIYCVPLSCTGNSLEQRLKSPTTTSPPNDTVVLMYPNFQLLWRPSDYQLYEKFFFDSQYTNTEFLYFYQHYPKYYALRKETCPDVYNVYYESYLEYAFNLWARRLPHNMVFKRKQEEVVNYPGSNATFQPYFVVYFGCVTELPCKNMNQDTLAYAAGNIVNFIVSHGGALNQQVFLAALVHEIGHIYLLGHVDETLREDSIMKPYQTSYEFIPTEYDYMLVNKLYQYRDQQHQHQQNQYKNNTNPFTKVSLLPTSNGNNGPPFLLSFLLYLNLMYLIKSI